MVSTLKLLGVNMAREIAKGFKGLLLPGTLTKKTAGNRSATDITGGTKPLQTNFTFRGFVEDYSDKTIAETLILQGDRKIVVLRGSLSDTTQIPEPNDTLTIESETYEVVRVMRDPAGAIFECQSRRK